MNQDKVFYGSKLKSIFLLIVVSAFTVVGIFMIKDGEAVGWFVSGFFGLSISIYLEEPFAELFCNDYNKPYTGIQVQFA